MILTFVPKGQRWAQIHKHVCKIKIQNTVWKKLFKYKLCGKINLNTNTLFCILKIHKIHVELAIR